MKMNIDCVICFQKQALRALNDSDDVNLKQEVLRSVMKMLLDEDWTKTPPELAGKVYKIVNDISGIQDPYKELKRKSNETILMMFDKLYAECLNSPNPIYHAMKLAVAGNIMDFGAIANFDVHTTIQKVIDAEFAHDFSNDLMKKLETAKNLLYLADNSGEIVFDKLLLKLISEKYPNLKITFVVKAGPIINDATIEDVDQISLRELKNIKFNTLGNAIYSNSPSRESREVEEWIKSHDVVIAKGQGNYEGFSKFKDLKKIFFLLMAKCPIVARDLNVQEQSFLIYY